MSDWILVDFYTYCKVSVGLLQFFYASRHRSHYTTRMDNWTTKKRIFFFLKNVKLNSDNFKGRNLRVIYYFSGSSSSGLILLTLGIPLGSLLLSSVLGMDDVELGLRSLCSS